jgi:4'-phosphopantetheinyl transferase EntD
VGSVQAERMDDGDAELANALLDLQLRYPTISFASDRLDACTLDLTYDEALCVVDFVPRKRAEFAAGRRAARKALGRFGLGSSSIVIGARGAPMFPSGYIGSISHKGNYAVAVAGSIGNIIGVGIDLEFDVETEEVALLERVSSHREVKALGLLTGAGVDSPATLTLCAKESLFKALNPLDGEPRDLQDVELSFGDGTFVVLTMEPPDHSRRVVGTFVQRGSLLISLVVIEPYVAV